MATSISDRVLQTLSEMQKEWAGHFARDKDTCEKVDAMYKVVVTGNGRPSLTETVRQHEAYIEEQKKKDEQERETRMKFILLGAGEVVSIIGLAIAVWLGLK